MTVADDLAQMRALVRPPGTGCVLCAFLEALPADVQASARAAIADRSIRSPGIVRWLKDKGYTIPSNDPAQAISRHRQADHDRR